MASLISGPGDRGFVTASTVFDRARFMSGFSLKTYSKPFAKCQPTGLTISKNNDFIIADNAAKTIKIFNRMGQLKTEFGSGKLLKPWDVTQVSNGEIFVSDPGAKEIKIFSPQGDFLRSFPPSDHVTEPYGITANSDQEILLTNKGSNSVAIFKSDGTFLKVISPPEHVKFQWPQHVAVDHRNNVIVSDNAAHALYGLDLSGRVVFKYGTKGTGQGQLVCPQGVCVDKHGHIIVADSGNDRIHLLSAEGRFQQFTLTSREGIETPVAVGIDTEGHLVFTEGATAELKSYLYLT